ncbi:related to Imitation switch two complex protein 1 [Zygosaccharomyces bailii]|nr:related to Imitation switch two complex protein 1 [Zygosaccharomyces bailii]
MVLYKRKPIVLPDPRPLPTDLSIYVWHIDETGEWFITYEEYLERLDFYTRHHFTCEITGTSCLTFFEALDSEETEFRYVEDRFPLKLREPVARFLHFNGVKRLDALVEKVYSKFKNDFFPGEVVYLRKNNKDISATSSHQPSPQPEDSNSGAKENGEVTHPQYQRPYVIKEKAQFNATTDPDTGEVIMPAHSKYMLIEEPHGSKSLIADQSQLHRDRTTFTKHLIKCFCKITLKRASSKMGAPWAVKEEYLPMYGLTMDWPPEMLKYKDDEPVTKQENSKGKRKKVDEDLDHQQDDENRKIDDEGKVKNEEETHFVSNKRKKTTEDDKEDSVAQEPAPSGTITSIVEDSVLPYQGSPHIFENLFHYTNFLESVPVNSRLPFEPFRETQKLLQVFQFLTTFGPKLYLSYFNLDQFITSLKCTDPHELKGEVVYVEFVKDGKESSFTEPESDWQRNPGIRQYIRQRNTERIRYHIVKDDPASEDIVDNVNHNGSGLLMECISALLRLFVNENGDWVSLVVEEWLDSKDEEYLDGDNVKSEKREDDKEDSNENSVFDEINETLEKCLNYRNINWAERLSKRQFNNHYWMLIILGIFQDCMHISLYTDIIYELVEKLVPSDISATQLPKQLWRNFCFKLTLEQKLNCIWILVDLISNFSPDVKAAVEESMDLCGQIRSERFRFAKDLKAETSYLNMMQVDLNVLEQAGNRDEAAIESHKERISPQAAKVDQLQKDKQFLDKKLMENDLQRLKTLGLDRYGNRYYWMDLSGIPINVGDDTEELNYHSGRLWIQGPAAAAAQYFLAISSEELNEWKKLTEEMGKVYATRHVFHICRTTNGAYKYVEGENETELCNSDGIINSLIELTPIQKKIIDETPDCLLLSEEQWYSVDRVEDVRRLLDWFDNWGRREHDLLKQFKLIEDTLENVYAVRDKVLHLFTFDDEEEQLLKGLQEYELNDVELNFGAERQEEATNGEKIREKDEEKEEEELEDIAGKIMELDDSSKTRKILNMIRELEVRRDELLAKRQATISAESSGGRALARAEKKRLKNVIDGKLEKQAEILTDLLNHRHFNAMEDAINWKNHLATKILGTPLRKNATDSKKSKNVDTVDAKLKEIMRHTSRISAASG